MGAGEGFLDTLDSSTFLQYGLCEMSKVCPRCKMLSPDDAIRCDCGYEFPTIDLKESSHERGNEQVMKRDASSKRWLAGILATVGTAWLGLGVLLLILIGVWNNGISWIEFTCFFFAPIFPIVASILLYKLAE